MLLLALPTSLRLLALDVVEHSGSRIEEIYRVDNDGKLGMLRHDQADVWHFTAEGGDTAQTTMMHLGNPDAVFAAALGQEPDPQQLRDAAPYWPDETLQMLERRGLCGAGTIAFDGATFLDLLVTSPMDRPLLLPRAADALESLGGLSRARELLDSFATTLRRVDINTNNAFAEALQGVERAESAVAAIRALSAAPSKKSGAACTVSSSPLWSGAGRLIAQWPDGELAQLGTDVTEGCGLALGRGFVRATFSADAPLGIWFYPLARDARLGCEVGGLEPGGAAERLGVEESMVLTKLEGPDALGLKEMTISGLKEMEHDEVLALIDERRDAGAPLTLVFETAAPTSRLYAVEMPAVPCLAALAESEGQARGNKACGEAWRVGDADASGAVRTALQERRRSGSGSSGAAEAGGAEAGAVGAGSNGRAASGSAAGARVLWREEETKAFLGEAGSATSAHVDIAPQLELAHGLCGLKFVGVASHEETARLLAEHAADVPGNAPPPLCEPGSPFVEATAEFEDSEDFEGFEDFEDFEELVVEEERIATSVPTDRPLAPSEASLLCDPAVSVVALRPGALLVFSSAALHFASNGACGLSAALYHGMVTEASLPRLQEAVAARGGGEGVESEHGAPGEALSAREVLEQIARGQTAENP